VVTAKWTIILSLSKAKIQVLAQPRAIQTQLSEYSLKPMPDSRRISCCYRSSFGAHCDTENWIHVSAGFQNCPATREAAQVIFNQLSIGERGKFGWSSRRILAITPLKDLQQDNDQAHTLVTLLIGTEMTSCFAECLLDSKLKLKLLEYISSLEYQWRLNCFGLPNHRNETSIDIDWIH